LGVPLHYWHAVSIELHLFHLDFQGQTFKTSLHSLLSLKRPHGAGVFHYLDIILVSKKQSLILLLLLLAVTDPKVLIEGVLFRARYLGSTQLVSPFEKFPLSFILLNGLFFF